MAAHMLAPGAGRRGRRHAVPRRLQLPASSPMLAPYTGRPAQGHHQAAWKTRHAPGRRPEPPV